MLFSQQIEEERDEQYEKKLNEYIRAVGRISDGNPLPDDLEFVRLYDEEQKRK